VAGKVAQINVTVSWLVPKSHTPFGWLAQKPCSYFDNARQIILTQKRKLNARFIQFKFHDTRRSVLESAIGRADRRLADVIETAWRLGAMFDLWDEHFNYQLWQQAFEKSCFSIDALAQRQFGHDEILPWEHIGGPDKDYLLGHLDAARL
jgi:radical SAM superfamily enzyme YgiQ (UPF0313 family)